MPGVLQLAVFGMPDEQWGQKVCVAFVADRAGAEGHAGGRVRPPGALQAAEGLLRHNRVAAHGDREVVAAAVPTHLGLAEEKEAGPG